RKPPAATATSPKKRICPSRSPAIRRNISRHCRGASSGRMPSKSSIRPTAMSTVAGSTDRRPRSAGHGLAGAALEEAEELRGRVDHQQVAAIAEGRLVGAEAAVEGRELRIAPEGLGVDGRGLRVALALDALRIPVGLREDDLALPLGVRADPLGF